MTNNVLYNLYLCNSLYSQSGSTYITNLAEAPQVLLRDRGVGNWKRNILLFVISSLPTLAHRNTCCTLRASSVSCLLVQSQSVSVAFIHLAHARKRRKILLEFFAYIHFFVHIQVDYVSAVRVETRALILSCMKQALVRPKKTIYFG